MWTLNGNFVGIHRASTRIPPAVYANSNTWIVVTLGQIPTQIDYAEYRESDGVQIPAKITVTDTQNVLTMHFSDVRQNVAIDPKVFTSNGARPQR